MSISDTLMWRYFELLSFRPMREISSLQSAVQEGRNPRDVKFELGVELVDRFHGVGKGNQARDAFVARFREGQLPDQIPEFNVSVEASGAKLPAILKEVQLVSGTSAGVRMIEQGAVRLDGEKVSDRDLTLLPGRTVLIQVGKRGFARANLLNK
jgi:tyrosyl-tRNA synthetase